MRKNKSNEPISLKNKDRKYRLDRLLSGDQVFYDEEIKNRYQNKERQPGNVTESIRTVRRSHTA